MRLYEGNTDVSGVNWVETIVHLGHDCLAGHMTWRATFGPQALSLTRDVECTSDQPKVTMMYLLMHYRSDIRLYVSDTDPLARGCS